MMPILLDSFIFWLIITTLVCCCLYIIREYVKLRDYESRVTRGWDDMINRADRIISRLENIEHMLNQPKKKTPKQNNNSNTVKH